MFICSRKLMLSFLLLCYWCVCFKGPEITGWGGQGESPTYGKWWLNKWGMLTKFQQETHTKFQAKTFQHAWWRQASGLAAATQPGLSHRPGPSPATAGTCSSPMQWAFAQLKLSHSTTIFLLFVLTAPWEQRERLCAVCSWECTSMDNRAAEIPWCLPLSEQIVPVPLLSLGFCGFFFSKKFPESAHCIERRTLNWTKMTACPFTSLKIWRLSEGKF